MKRLLRNILLALLALLDDEPVAYRLTEAGRDALREGTEDAN